MDGTRRHRWKHAGQQSDEPRSRPIFLVVDGAAGVRAKAAEVDFFFVLSTWLRARFGRDERGANLVEYLLLVSLIAIAVMGAVAFLGSQLSPKFSQAGSQLSSAPGP